MYLGTPEVQSNQIVVIAGDSPAFENRCKPGGKTVILCSDTEGECDQPCQKPYPVKTVRNTEH